MKEQTPTPIAVASEKQKKGSVWRIAVPILAVVVFLCTTAALIMPAVTQSRTICGIEEHIHTDDCYAVQPADGQLTLDCSLESLGVHVHEADCFDAQHKAICGWADYVAHQHSTLCYEDGELVCQLTKIKPHTHSESCYEQVLACTEEESPDGHTHDEGCYDICDTLICEEPEVILHTHSDPCFRTEQDGSKTLICTQQQITEHSHSESCCVPKTVRTVVCPAQVHTHCDECYPVEETEAEAETEAETDSAQAAARPNKGVEKAAPLASGTCGENVTWTITEEDGNQTLTISGTGNITSAPWSSYRPTITRVVIEEGVTSIFSAAFKNYKSITSVTIPNSVTAIGSNAFDSCSALTSVSIPDSVTSINDYTFRYCTALTSVSLPEGITHIGYCAFEECTALTSVSIPKSVTAIGSFAFMDCYALTTVSIPKSVTRIDTGAFRNCSSLESVYIADLSSWCETSFGDNTSNPLYHAHHLYLNGNLVEELIIPEGVTSIGKYAFYGCSDVTSLTIPTTVGYIYSSAFVQCTSLKTIYLNAKDLDTCQYNSFAGCNAIEKVIIGQGVDTLYPSVFSAVNSPLDENAAVEFIGPNHLTLSNNFSNSDISNYLSSYAAILKSNKNLPFFFDMYGAVYSVCDDVAYYLYSPMSNYTPPATISTEDTDERVYQVHRPTLPTRISLSSSLSWLLYPEENGSYELAIIGAGPIIDRYQNDTPWNSYRSQISSVHIANTITAIGNYAFYGCNQVKTVQIPSQTTTVSTSAFQGCTSLASFTVAEGNTALSEEGGILYNQDQTVLLLCPPAKKTARSIPESATTISAYAFYQCTLSEATFPASIATIEEYAFYNCDNLKVVTIPGNGVTIGQYAFSDCDSLQKLMFSGSEAAKIGESAFYHCDNLAAVTFLALPSNIEASAFSNCANITSFTFAGSGYITIGTQALPKYISPCAQLHGGLYYKDEYGAYYWICDGNAYFVMCPPEETDYQLLSQIPKIGTIGPYPVDTRVSDFLDYGAAGDVAWYIIEKNDRTTLVITGSSTTGDYSNSSSSSYVPWAAYRSQINEIILDPGITAIGNYSFYGFDALQSYEVPNHITRIGRYAFNKCTALTSVTVPTSVTAIDSDAFYDCKSLTSVTLPDSLTNISDFLFKGCTSLTSIVLPTQLTNIGHYAFENCTALTSVTLPDNLIKIGTAAFRNCRSLQAITIPESTAYVGNYAFENCSGLKSVVIEGNTHLYTYAFINCANLTDLTFHQSVKGNYEIFTGSTNLNVVLSGSNISVVGTVFQNCSALTSVTVSGSNVTFQDGAFEGCSDLRDVHISSIANWCGNTFVSLESNPLYFAENLYLNGELVTDVVIPDGIEAIGDYAFFSYDRLTGVALPQGYINLSNSVFAETPVGYLIGTIYTDDKGIQYKIISERALVVYVPEGVAESDIPDYIDETGNNYPVIKTTTVIDSGPGWEILYVDGVTTLIISSSTYNYSLHSLPPWYDYHGKIQNVIIESGVTRIGDYAFYDLSELRSVTIPDSVTLLGSSAFQNCISLTEVSIPKSIPVIDDNAFSYCYKLAEVNLEEGLSKIGISAFQYCTSLTEVSIPKSVLIIDDAAFSHCYELTTVNLEEGLQAIGNSAFAICRKLESIDIPDSVTIIGTWIFEDARSLTQITVGEGLSTLHDGTFGYAVALKEFTIPKNLTRINTWGLLGCTGLETIIVDAKEFSSCSTYALKDTRWYYEIPKNINKVVVDTGVDTLYESLFKVINASTEKYPSVEFRGPNHFKIDPAFSAEMLSNLGAPISNLVPGVNYFVDAQGAFYVVENGEASLYYVPAGIQELTIPATIPGIAEDAEPIPVTRILSNALRLATDLTAITFAEPSAITELADYALANCPTLTSVNGKTTKDDALAIFDENTSIGIYILVNTGLRDKPLVPTTDVIELGSQYNGIYVTFHTDSDPSNHITDLTAFYTGQIAYTTVYIENQSTHTGDTVRLYFQFDSADGLFGFRDRTFVEYKTESGNSITIPIGKVGSTNTYYMDLSIGVGDTHTFNVQNHFPSPTSGGGTLTIWGELIHGNPGEYSQDIRYCNQVIWHTKPDDFALVKEVVNEPKMYGTGEEDGQISIHDLSYHIDLKPTKSRQLKNDNWGRDHMLRADYTDVITLPANLHWSEGLVSAIRDGNWQAVRTSEQNQWGYNIMVTIDGEQTKAFRIHNDKITDVKLGVTAGNQVSVGWTYRNPKPTQEMPTTSLKLQVAENMILGYYARNFEEPSVFRLVNDITVVQHFSYSGTQVDTYSLPHEVSTNAASMTLEKWHKLEKTNINPDKYSAYYGEAFPYTIEMSNFCTQHIQSVDTISDTLVDKLYIKAEDIYTMLCENEGGDHLTVTIDKATLYDPEVVAAFSRNLVTGSSGNAFRLNAQNTSGPTNDYSNGQLSDVENSVLYNSSVRIVIKKAENGVTVSFVFPDGKAEIVRTAASGAALQQLLNEMGYFVTPMAQYSLYWEFPADDPMPLWSGQTRTFPILSTVKDAFMQISIDYYFSPIWNNNESIEVELGTMGTNQVGVTYRVKADGSANETISLYANSKDVRLHRDFTIMHTYTSSGSVLSDTNSVQGGGLVDLHLQVDYDGSNAYDIVPVSYYMSGAQMLMVRAVDNPHLSDLPVKTIGGIDYYALDRAGTYKNVKIDGFIADRVIVNVPDDNSGSTETLIHWYLENINGPVDLKIDMQVLFAVNADFVEETSFHVDGVSWLNDHQSHRLLYPYGTKWTFLEFEKDIVHKHTPGTYTKDVLDPDNYTVIREGNTVTYRLKMTGLLSATNVQAGKTLTISGSTFYDILPENPNDWVITNLEYVYDPNAVELRGESNYSVTRINPKTAQASDHEQYIVWTDACTVTYRRTASLFIYVTLQYPTDDAWRTYGQLYGNQMLTNTFCVSDDTAFVQHSLYLRASGILAKGVNSSGILDGNVYRPSLHTNSREVYNYQDCMQRLVTYYVVLYNDGYTRIYLNPIEDKLPDGFTFYPQSVKVASGADVNIADWAGSAVRFMDADIHCDVNSENGHLMFTASDGHTEDSLRYDPVRDMYYLLPNEALAFTYQCFTGTSDSADVEKTNTVAMPYYNYNDAGIELGSSIITGTNAYPTEKNDGSRELFAGLTNPNGFHNPYSTETQWLTSKVMVKPGHIVPGISKWVEDVLDATLQSTRNPIHAHYSDQIVWNVQVTNTGSSQMYNYVLTDVMQREYDFLSSIQYTIGYDSNFGINDLTHTATLFSMADVLSAGINPKTGRYEKQYTSNTFGTFKVYYTPCDRNDPDSNATLSIHFMDEKAAIPEGGSGTISVITKNKGSFWNTTYTNLCYITPFQNWMAENVKVGEPVAFDSKITGFENKLSVCNQAQITVADSFVTTSVKAVTENIDPANTTDSNQTKPSIVLKDGENTFRYTLTIHNNGGSDKVMDKLVITDTLPAPNDRNVLQNIPRYSQFQVDLTEEPNFTVQVDGVDLDPGKFRIEFCKSSDLVQEDWEASDTGIGKNVWSQTDMTNARSFRIIIEADIRSGSTVTVSFDACIHAEHLADGTAFPGTVAWNTFAYYYELANSLYGLSSEPLKVGVRLPSVPVLRKQLQTPDGDSWNAEKDETFSYLIYKQDSAATMLNLDGLSEEEIATVLHTAGAEFTKVFLTVPAGHSQSEALSLHNLHTWHCTRTWVEETQQWKWDWVEDSQIWEWTNNDTYIFHELPIVNEQDYTYGSLGSADGFVKNDYSYLHDGSEDITIVSTNLRKVWHISLKKESASEDHEALSGAWFGLYSLQSPGVAVEIPAELADTEVATSLSYTDENGVEACYYLTGIACSNEEGILLWENLPQQQYVIQELKAPDGYHYDDTIYAVSRPGDVIFNTQSLIVYNRCGIEMPESGSIGTHWVILPGILLIAAAGILLAAKKRKESSPY